MASHGVVLVNLGSPNSPAVDDVRQYLNTFLMDPYVIDLPWWLRRLLVSLLVLPRRPAVTAKAYQAIWTEQGSPLICHSQQLAASVAKRLTVPVELAMRYGQPALQDAILRLAKTPGIREILLFPLYPHYAMSTVKSAVAQAHRIVRTQQLAVKLRVHPVFFDHPDYIEALVTSAQPWLTRPYDHLLISFHGVPLRHLRKDDPTGQHCLKHPDCCVQPSVAHQTCYRHQVYQTAASFVAKAGIAADRYTVTFQSRLGRDRWLEPNTLTVLRQLARQGIKNVLVICPSFVADCLETLEEIDIAAQAAFIAAGGESLQLIPCLNAQAAWVKVLCRWLS